MKTFEEEQAAAFRRAVERMALAVRQLAEERHDTQNHQQRFSECDESCCANIREAYLAI